MVCKIFFLATWWVGYFFTAVQEFFSITFVLHAIFFFRQALAGNFFSKSPTPPPPRSRVKWSAPYLAWTTIPQVTKATVFYKIYSFLALSHCCQGKTVLLGNYILEMQPPLAIRIASRVNEYVRSGRAMKAELYAQAKEILACVAKHTRTHSRPHSSFFMVMTGNNDRAPKVRGQE